MHAVKEAERFVPVAGGLDREAFTGQSGGERLAVGLLVVDDEHQRTVVPRRPRKRGPAAHRRRVCDCHADFGLRQRRGGPGGA